MESLSPSTMAYQEAFGRLSGHEPASSALAGLPQCRALASETGSLGGSTDSDSSIDIVGLGSLETAAPQADNDTSTLQRHGRFPRVLMSSHSGSRRRPPSGSLRLQADVVVPKQHQPELEHPATAAHDANVLKLVDYAQHLVNGTSLSAVQAAADKIQQPGCGIAPSAYLGDFGDYSLDQCQHHGQQGWGKHIVHLDNGVESDETAVQEDAEQDNAGEQQWSSKVCCACNDGGEVPNTCNANTLPAESCFGLH